MKLPLQAVIRFVRSRAGFFERVAITISPPSGHLAGKLVRVTTKMGVPLLFIADMYPEEIDNLEAWRSGEGTIDEDKLMFVLGRLYGQQGYQGYLACLLTDLAHVEKGMPRSDEDDDDMFSAVGASD